MNKIYARKTVAEIVDLETAQDFVEKYHNQQSASPSTVIRSVGLFLKDELIAVAQFCSPRTSAKKREYTTELLRLCFKKDYRVTGGASKLIEFYKKRYKPSDIFTYQDTTGENTDVYEHCGFTLKSQSKKKTYLIAPNKTIKNAKKYEKLSVAYAVRLGPDNILGTNLGEVFDDDGTRKTNIQLFTDVLGWTLEETTGDKVYEWFDKNVTFYTYKITATDSDKYYYGVSHIREPISDNLNTKCLNDGYYGSGGKQNANNKFANWKIKHKDKIEKEIIKLFKKKSEAYLSEKTLVGDAWNTDKNCLNSIQGGRYTGTHTGTSPRLSDKECPLHGITTHAGNTCCKCTSEKSISTKECKKHGTTKFIGEKCRKCLNTSKISIKNCIKHGDVKHINNNCYKCADSSFKSELKNCEIHGVTAYVFDKCSKCSSNSLYSMKDCSIHGITKHRIDTCSKCSSNSSISKKDCPTHGSTTHAGTSCSQCTSESSVTIQHCPTHGLTKFSGNSCRSCLNLSVITVKDCSIHGKTKHIGDKCYKCRDDKYDIKVCSIHGKSSFVGDNCAKCSYTAAVSEQVCNVHGMTTHMFNACSKCRSSNAINMGDCAIHGLTKHRGATCSKCTADKGAHRHHKNKTNLQ